MATLTIIESGAIIDYVIRRHGGAAWRPDPASADYDRYQQWLHYAEGSAMLPLMLNMYVGRLGEAGAPLHPRIDRARSPTTWAMSRPAWPGGTVFVGDDLPAPTSR
jgi:glutathione S-transferase